MNANKNQAEVASVDRFQVEAVSWVKREKIMLACPAAPAIGFAAPFAMT